MKFSDIVGHAREIEILRKAIALDRVPHAYIFSGMDGTGKSLVAGAFARALNCEAPQGWRLVRRLRGLRLF